MENTKAMKQQKAIFKVQVTTNLELPTHLKFFP